MERTEFDMGLEGLVERTQGRDLLAKMQCKKAKQSKTKAWNSG